ncbi:MAG TPA: DUF1588 domain-containing protein [Marinagarivorans sp.]
MDVLVKNRTSNVRWLQRLTQYAFGVLALLLLAACGGGGSAEPSTGNEAIKPLVVVSSAAAGSSLGAEWASIEAEGSSTQAEGSSMQAEGSSTQAEGSSIQAEGSQPAQQPASSSTLVRSSAAASASSDASVEHPPKESWPARWQLFDQTVAPALVNVYCITCHVDTGMAANTPLVFDRGNNYRNVQTMEDYVLNAGSGDRLLRKITGFDGHGGGAIVNQQQAEYHEVQAWLDLTLPPDVQAAAAFTALRLEPRLKTLRRAALIIAGRLPTRDESDRAVRSDQELKKVLKDLMQTPGFELFLMRGANDQLLTDSFLNGQFFELSNGFAPYYPVGSNARYAAYESGDIWPFERWNHEVYHGMVRAPLALIAHTVMTDQPYTNIVTADYTLGNQSIAEYMRQQVQFAQGDKFDVKPMKNHGQILVQPGHQQTLDPNIGLRIDQHGAWVDYPHAGILNEPAFLARYPSSDTNRNRLRAKMVYRLFLGVDIEDIAARTLATEALTDTDNPTLKNDACAVCHETLDPVAGAFQNFGVEGWYRSSWGGMDGLPKSYKHEPDSPYQHGDLWFRDMRTPGFEGTPIADSARSLAELGAQIATDDRFAEAAVKFWWPAIMSDELLPETVPPTALYQQQQQFIRDLAAQFRDGFDGGRPYRLKDLLVELLMSDWFRAERVEFADEQDAGAQSLAGVRLLTPEELENKVRSLVGFAWGEREDFWANNGLWSYLDDRFRIYYGGIDSLGVTERAKVQNSLMANVAESQAVNLACAAVLLDANRDATRQRLLRNQARYVSPFSNDWQFIELANPQFVTLSLTLAPGQNRIRVSHLNAERVGPVVFDAFQLVATDGTVLFDAKKVDTNHVDTQGASATLSQEAAEATGLIAGGMMILEKGYIDIQFDAKTHTDIQLRTQVLTPIAWPEPAQVSVDVIGGDNSGEGKGLQLVRQQIVELFSLTQGIDYGLHSIEVNEALDTFIAIWQSLEMQATPMTLAQHANNYCELGVKGLPKIRDLNTSDPQRLLSAWSHMMVYFFTDFYFLHE